MVLNVFKVLMRDYHKDCYMTKPVPISSVRLLVDMVKEPVGTNLPFSYNVHIYLL